MFILFTIAPIEHSTMTAASADTATAHSVSPAQVALRWLIQQDPPISIVTAADTPEYCAEDMDLFSFELTAAEMATLAAL